MEIIKYTVEHHLVSGDSVSDHLVRCVWYENGERNTDTFDQRTLFKVHTDGGLSAH